MMRKFSNTTFKNIRTFSSSIRLLGKEPYPKILGYTEKDKKPYFNKILIANRGEIACRIIRTAKALGIKTVAVFSDADANSKHVKMADEAYYIGPSQVNQSYTKVENILKACVDTGAEAVHPGFGFLSENSEFCKALEDKGIIFIGPKPYAMHAMGDKIESKKVANNAKVSCIPGYDGEVKSAEEAVKIANATIKYPVMIKASAGGGGKGMRICWNDDELREGFRLSQAEAKMNFANDLMLIEKYIEEPRHIEIQIIGDNFGNFIYLNERECSIQRRNQKVIEEAPSPRITPELRKAMGTQACQLARAVGYVSAGTVEMLMDKDGNFFFLEMNTRLQVEHPISEYITDVDIVEQMIRVAAGFPLSYTQDDIKVNGWATECRVYAEDPMNNFAPSVGNLTKYVEPSDTEGNIRVDSGVEERAEISVFYDPMISKTIAYGKTREESIQKMKEALDIYIINGVRHNVSLLRTILEHPKYLQGAITTNFIKESFPGGFKGINLTDEEWHQLIGSSGVIEFLYRSRFMNETEDTLKGYIKPTTYKFIISHKEGKDEKDVKAKVTKYPVSIETIKEGCEYKVTFDATGKSITLKPNYEIGQTIFRGTFNGNLQEQVFQIIERKADSYILQYKGTRFEFGVRSPKQEAAHPYMPYHPPPDLSKFLISPMPGAIVSVSVKVGDTVKTHEEICVMEAMKMQNVLRSIGDLKVKKVNIKPGMVVGNNEILIEFE